MSANDSSPGGAPAGIRRTLVVGLTGGLASGKSTVGKLLRDRGVDVIDADELARLVVEPGRPAYRRIVAEFGEEVLVPPAPESGDMTGQPTARPIARPIDRARLAARVFGDEAARSLLNRITHPEIARESAERMAAASARGALFVVYEAALIVENKLYHGLDGLIVVDAPEELQIERAMQRSGLTREQAAARLRAQASRSERRAVANWLIDNTSDRDALQRQVERVLAELSAGHIPPRPAPAAP
ncbi:MAG: dephospho-CoA kinase [Polyangia bacterium]